MYEDRGNQWSGLRRGRQEGRTEKEREQGTYWKMQWMPHREQWKMKTVQQLYIHIEERKKEIKLCKCYNLVDVYT